MSSMIHGYVQQQQQQSTLGAPPVPAASFSNRSGFYFRRVGVLEGHKKRVTQLATTPANDEILLSSSRDRTIMIWRITANDPFRFAVAHKSLRGHGQSVTDVVFSSDGTFALSGSLDKSLRLWDIRSATCTRRFLGHEGDVLSVSFSGDNRQIVSGSRDKTIKLWNTLGQCKYTMSEDCTDWISSVRFSPDQNNPLVVSGSWDKTVKVWNLKNCKLRATHYGHTGYINAVAVSPDGSLCASGGRDGKSIIWEVNENKCGNVYHGLDTVNALAFSPKRFWLSSAAGPVVRIYDLNQKVQVVDDIKPSFVDENTNYKAECTSVAWSPNGNFLYAGYDDGKIVVYEIFS
ncbi:hypothetical protein ACOME3_005529 [Neoechinorhynchus agilis]